MTHAAVSNDPALESEILMLSRQEQTTPLTDWFATRFGAMIDTGVFAQPSVLKQDLDTLIDRVRTYGRNSGLSHVVLGMSGGVDSALTAALFREAGWTVLGYTLPILQDPTETARGVEACDSLGIAHTQIDLTAQYQAMFAALEPVDPALTDGDDRAARIRHGNIRARLRMITLYNQAHANRGLVASTDNFSELSAGFWTINGDVGDLAPVQSLMKSWEVPWMARDIGVPESIWRAKPTDGLGIDDGDEAQIGATYLQWDIAVRALMELFTAPTPPADTDWITALGATDDDDACRILRIIETRLRGTRFKRAGSQMLPHPREPRFEWLSQVDAA